MTQQPGRRTLFAVVATATAFLMAVPVPVQAERSEESPPAHAGRSEESALARRPAGPPTWARKIDRLIGRRSFGVAVREGDGFLYRHEDARRRIPASNEKLLLSMAILDLLGPEARLVTQAAASPLVSGVVAGDLWILGQGDPTLGPSQMQKLADAIQAAGVLRIDGSVMGSTGYFKRDWRAPGWKPYFPRQDIPLPTALTFDGNTDRGIHIRDPELRAAKALDEQLEERGIVVAGKPGAGEAPDGLLPVAQIQSRPLLDLLEFTNRYSSNFFAEVLGKRLGAEYGGVPGSIAKGAAAMRAWASEQGVAVRARDASGLSYANRVSPEGLVRLLGAAELELWGETFRDSLARPGQGTLEGRMRHVEVRAKTGTLSGVSSLSGWVLLRRVGVWAEFSILSRGVTKDQAVRVEDAIVRILARSATLAS